MYYYNTIPEQVQGAEHAQTKEVVRYGVLVYVDTDADGMGPDFMIDPEDQKGIELFREFARKMAEHYKSITPQYENNQNPHPHLTGSAGD